MSDAEMNMLPPGQNKPHQRMMSEAGAEMGIDLGIIAGGAALLGGLFGKSEQKQSQKREADRQYQLQQQQIANQAAQQAYAQEYQAIMTGIENRYIQEEFGVKLDLYDEQLQINRDAADSAYSSEKFQHIERMQQAALNRQKMFKELVQVQGSQRARGGMNVNKSRQRADLINSLGEFGRDQAEFDKTLDSARSALNQRLGGIKGQHANADYQAWTKIAITPKLKLPGMGSPDIINQVGPAQVNTGIGFGDFFSSAAQALQLGLGAAALASDAELKENIKHVGKSSSGINIFEFNYVGETIKHRGAMAQEVLMKKPEAVVEMDNGYLGINYGMIDVKMETVKS